MEKRLSMASRDLVRMGMIVCLMSAIGRPGIGAAAVAELPTTTAHVLMHLDASDLDGDGVAEGFAEDGLSGSGGAYQVTNWVDKGSLGHNVSQADTSMQPWYRLTGLNAGGDERPYVWFDSDYLQTTQLLGGTRGTVVLFCRMDVTGDYRLLSQGDTNGTLSGSLAVGLNDNNSTIVGPYIDFMLNRDLIYGSTAETTGEVYRLFVMSDDSAYSMRLNGTNQTMSAYPGTGPNRGRWFGDVANADVLAIGCLMDASIGMRAYRFKGAIAEVIVFDTELTGTDLDAVDEYLCQKYQVAASKPAVTNGLAAWFKGGGRVQTLNYASTEIPTWYDSWGTNVATAANVAWYVEATEALNGVPTLNFDTTDELNFAPIAQTTGSGGCAVIVHKVSGNTAGAYYNLLLRDPGVPTSPILYGNYTANGGKPIWLYSGGAASSDASLNTWKILFAGWDASSSYLHIVRPTVALASSSGWAPAVNWSWRALSAGEYAQGLDGNMAEVMLFQRSLNSGEITILANALGAKYNLIDATSGLDFYAGDSSANGDYDLDVVGIGQAGWGDFGKSAASGSSGLLLAEANGSITNGEYLLAGHRSSVNSSTTNGLSALVFRRWQRVWYVDKTGSLDATLTFDASEASMAFPALAEREKYCLLYSPSTSLSFSILGATRLATGDQVSFTVLDAALQDGYYTLGVGKIQGTVFSTR